MGRGPHGRGHRAPGLRRTYSTCSDLSQYSESLLVGGFTGTRQGANKWLQCFFTQLPVRPLLQPPARLLQRGTEYIFKRPEKYIIGG